jgi:hypothetical protein
MLKLNARPDDSDDADRQSQKKSLPFSSSPFFAFLGQAAYEEGIVKREEHFKNDSLYVAERQKPYKIILETSP